MPPSNTPLHALLARRAQLVTEAETLVSKADASSEDVAKGLAMLATAADVAAGTATAVGEIAQLDAQIHAINRLREAERSAPALPQAPAEASAHGPATVEPNIDPTAGFRNLAEMAMSVRRAVTRTGGTDQRLDRIAAGYLQHGDINATTPSNYHQETNSDTGGWEVPPQFREEIFEVAFSGTDIMSLLSMEPTTSNSIEMGKDESTPWGSTGIQAVWRVEAQQMTASKLATKGGRVELNELYAFVAATDELMADAPRLNARLTRGAGRAIEWVGSEAFMWGDGVGKPKGWMSSPALVTVSKESGQAAATITTKNLGKLFARLYRGPGAQPMVFANSDILPQLMELTIGQVPIWTPAASGFKDAPSGNILGLPVQWTEHSPTLGNLGDIQFVDLAGMYSAMRAGGVQFAESMHLWFDYGLTAFRWTVRLAGQPLLSAPIQPPTGKGSTTKSHFVTLEAR